MNNHLRYAINNKTRTKKDETYIIDDSNQHTQLHRLYTALKMRMYQVYLLLLLNCELS